MHPRIARSRMLVLAAAADELVERGWQGASVDRISAASGVAKTTIYHHWLDRTSLLLETADVCVSERPAPQTGTRRGDLTAALRGFAAGVSRGPSGAVTASLIGVAGHDPAAGSALATVLSRLTEPVHSTLERWGLPGSDADVDLLCGPILMRATLRRGAVRRTHIDHLVDSYLQSHPGRVTR